MQNLQLNKKERLKIIELLKKEPETKDSQKLIKRIEKSLKQIKPRSAKNKGLAWQKEVCFLISAITGTQYNQSDDQCEIHSRESGLNGVDVILRGETKELFPYAIECKNAKNISLAEWTRQAESNSDNLTLPNWLLFIKSPVLPMKKVVVMSIPQFIIFAKTLIAFKKKK